MRISGYASTKDVDSYNEIVEPSAFAETMADFMKFPILLFGHDWYSKPVGKIAGYRIDESGLWVDAEIADTAEGRDIAVLVEHGILKAFSIGFWSLSTEEGAEEGDPTIIKKLKLGEISIVNVPANAGALFDQVKSANLTLSTINQNSPDGGGIKRKGAAMSDAQRTVDQVEALVGGLKTSLDAASGEISNLRNNQEEQAKLIKQVADKQGDLARGLLTQGEFDTFAKKIGSDMVAIAADVKKANEARKLETLKMPFDHWKYNTRSLITMRDDQGVPLSDMHQKAYRLFNMPVKFDGEEGRMLKALRDIHDVAFVCSQLLGAKNNRFTPTSLKSYTLMKELAGYIDPEFAKAMYSTGSGLGDEWVPTGWSSELYDLYRLEAQLENAIPGFDMPTNPYIWPIKSGSASLYRASEAATNNPAILTKSNMATSSITFTAQKYAVAIAWSPEFQEDSIIAVVPALRSETAITAAHGWESALINSDNTADAGTHRDNASATRWASGTPETYEDGFREIAFQGTTYSTFDTQSTSTGVGDATAAFAAEDLRYLRKLAGRFGKNPANWVYVVPISAWFKMLSFTPLTQATAYGMGAPGTWRTGELPPFDGCQVVVTEHIDENQAATGLYTDGVTSSTYTSVFGFNKTCFKVGNRGPITLEMEKDIETQQWVAVSTMRKSFKKMTASGYYPVTLGFKVNN